MDIVPPRLRLLGAVVRGYVLHTKKDVSETYEMYLKVLVQLRRDKGTVRVRDMAGDLQVTLGTVSSLLKKMEHAGLVVHERYGAVQPTAAGMRVGECVIRRFETIMAFLIEVLGVPSAIAEIDACRMEHAVSPATINRLKHFLRSVQSNEIDLRSRDESTTLSSDRTCSECETTGVCGAEAALKPANE